ncbi:hypothetical protein CALVIDRAFT_556304 [Calocera viscosa TUFC12733]|uniref:C2H2-type domain-containing protein n=1 Tax=Calocera viscosa (strain TUFC12733) TaxID=1330018 RepID=A0A167KCN8_CALVF|nr:hypothetical protein CALVIDRAFT_556304 [Calocera viscosa TUFC12733]
MSSPFSALHDLSALASTLSPSPMDTSTSPQLVSAPIPMHATSASHAHTRSSHTPPSEASYSSTPSLSLSFSTSAASHSLSPYAPGLPASYAASTPGSGGLAAAAGKEHRMHRRQSSSGHKRRLSDARDALSMTRPFSLTADSPPLPPALTSQSVPAPSYMSARRGSTTKREVSSKSTSSDDGKEVQALSKEAAAAHVKDGKRIYVCEDCQKVYRHRSCMDKHRWEHSPHWLPSSKFLLSKHQQVQLLEAAAILSHISAPARSLPDDRALWPKYLAEVATAPGPQVAGKPRPARASKWTAVAVSGRKSVSVYDGESMLGEIDMDDDEVDVVGDDRSVSGSVSAMGVDEEDEETEDEIEVVRPWEGVGGLEMEL